MGFTAAADRGGFVGASSSSSSSRGDGGTTPSARDNTIHGVYGPHLVRRLELVLAHRAHAEGFVGCLRRAEAMAYVERDVGDHLRDAIHAAFDADGFLPVRSALSQEQIARYTELCDRTVASRIALRRSGASDFLALSSSMERPAMPRVMAEEVTILFFAFFKTSS